MQYFLIFIIIFTTTIHASTIRCYDGGKIIYTSVTDDIVIEKEFIIVNHEGYDDLIIREDNKALDCYVTTKTKS